MRKKINAAAAFSAAVIAALALSGCPTQSSYPATITPIYAATSTGLSIYDGTRWTSYTRPGANAVVVSGSGAGAIAYIGDSTGVSLFNGGAWSATTNLGASSVARLFSGHNIYAATAAGVAILNDDGLSWTNNATVKPVSDVFSFRTYSFLAAGNLGLYVCNNGIPTGSAIPCTTILPGSSTVTAVFLDSFGDLFAATDLGLAVQSSPTSPWQPLISVAATFHQITMDQGGNLYAATSNGLYVLAAGTARYFPGTNVTCVCVDGPGTIYAGTAAGLQVSRNGGATWTTELAGQAVNAVTTTAPLYSF